MKKQPLSIWFLLVVFGGSCGAHIFHLARHQNSTDYFVLSQNGLGFGFFTLFFTIALLDFLTFQFIRNRNAHAVKIGTIDIVLSVAQTIWIFVLSLGALDATKQAYAANRAARGFPVRAEALDAIFSPPHIISALALSTGFTLFVLVLLIAKRHHFNNGIVKGH